MNLSERLVALVELLPDSATVTLEVGTIRSWCFYQEIPQQDLTVKQIAERLDRTPACVRSWIKKGELEGYRFRDREWRVTPASLAQFEQRQRQQKGEPARRKHADLGGWRRVKGRRDDG